MPRTAPTILLAVWLLVGTAFGDGVGDYQNRLGSARAGVQRLLDNVAADEAGEPVNEPNKEVFAAVRELIPASERIEHDGAIETSNKWFVERLDAAEAETDLTKRALILNEINERLAVVSLKLDELQNAPIAERSKDEDKRKLAEILNREEYQKPVQKQESAASEWVKKFFEWIESWFPKFNAPSGSFGGIGSAISVLQWVLIALIVAGVGFLIYKLVPIFAPRFRRKVKEAKPERVILGERIEDDMSSADLFSDAERLAREGDARGAIRKGYIALLCELSDRSLIGLARHKTNRDYLKDLRPQRAVHGQVGGLTGDFERHWYGEQTAAINDWEDFRRRCGEAIKTI